MKATMGSQKIIRWGKKGKDKRRGNGEEIKAKEA